MIYKTKIIFLCFLLLGCAGGEKIPLPRVEQPSATASPVQILAEKPAASFMILGRVQASAPKEIPDEALYQALQKQAEKLYAHAVVVQQGGVRIVRQGDIVQKHVEALAISYTNHPSVHQMPGEPQSDQEEDAEEQNTPTGFGLLP